MLTAETVHAESARYRAQIVCLPGLWTDATVWRPFAGYLAHRGWECHLLGSRGVEGGLERRAAAVAEYVEALGTPAVLVAHDAGAVVALAAARRQRPAALVLVAPLTPGRSVRRLTSGPRSLLALITGGAISPPSGREAGAWLDLPDAFAARVRPLLAAEDAATMRDLAWGRVEGAAAAGPALLVAGEADRLLPPRAAEALALVLGAELRVLAGAGHWPHAGPRWQEAVAVVHRWLVQRLGEALLELYAEAMAERDAEDD